MTERDVFALLVGVDRYAGDVPDLSGCGNDIAAVQEFLQARVSGAGDRLHLVTLVDEGATRDAVITEFRSHLGQAGPDDVALFYYSGHGSQEPAPEEFWPIEPDHLDETLVLHDSRTPGSWDLADKELAALLREVAGTETGGPGPHLVVVLDCCHSGSGTRAAEVAGGTGGIVGIRRAPSDRRRRPLSSFLFVGADGKATAVGDLGADPATRAQRSALGDSGWALPDASHVLIAGCRSNETSKELSIDGRVRGAMSAAIQQTLTGAGAGLTYRELHRQVSAIVRGSVQEQNPQLETEAATLDAPFLGGVVTAAPGSFVMVRVGNDWQLDGGLVHGIAAPVGTESTRVAVFAAGTDLSGQPPAPLTTGVVTQVRAADATVVPDDEGVLDAGLPYRAVVTATPLPPMPISITGTAAEVAALQAELAARDATGPLLVTVADPSIAVVEAGPGGYRIVVAGADPDLAPQPAGADEAVAALETIAQWRRVAALRNGSSRIRTDAVGFELALADPSPPVAAAGGEEPITEADGGYRISYEGTGPGAAPRVYTVTVSNDTTETLFFALLDLTDGYGIYTDALPKESEQLDPGTSRTLQLAAVVPDELFTLGVTETTDLLKLVVSTVQFDPRSLHQDDLELTRAPRAAGVRSAPSSTFDGLLQRVGTRRAKPVSAHGEPIADWCTKDLRVTAVRPGPGVRVVADAAVQVAPGVRIAAHPGFAGTVRMAAGADATRDLAVAPVPPLLADPDPTAQVAAFSLTGASALTGTRAPATDALVIDADATDVAAVTRDNPLVLTVETPLADGERILPFAWDGEFYIPLGYARPADGGRTEVVLERLSEPVVTSRSLFGSIRILFRKIIGKPLGLPFAYPLLRLASVAPDGTVTYDADRARIAAAVAAADTVVVYIHGIISDTAGMVRSATVTGVVPPPPLIGERYGAILTFDYENLHTTIEQNAQALQQRLADIGLGPGHDKQLDLVAHSMGGLVSRYLIEFVGDVRVRRLIMLGTPNGGSPWPVVQKWATGAAALAVNGLTVIAWPLTVLAGVLGALEQVDNALDEMEPGSDFLDTLDGAADPGVPYTVIIGNDSLLDADPQRVASLLQRVIGAAADVAFFFKPNDLAVAVTSARRVLGVRNPPVEFVEIACDHPSFFATSTGLTALADALP